MIIIEGVETTTFLVVAASDSMGREVRNTASDQLTPSI